MTTSAPHPTQPEPQDRLPSDPVHEVSYQSGEGIIAPLVPAAPAGAATGGVVAPLPAGPAPSSWSFMGDTKRDGAWTVAPVQRFSSGLGDVKLDLREATFAAPVVQIDVYSFMGDVKVVVPPDVYVDVRGGRLLGEQKIELRTDAASATRTVILNSSGALGDIKVVALEIGEVEPKFWQRRKRREQRELARRQREIGR